MSTMIMPFSKYFADDPPPEQQQQQQQQFRGNELQFQLPAFMQQGVPTLAHGGGAEVLPFNSTWFTNNAFYPSASLCPSQSDNISFPILTAPSPLGLPVYSASGFDILSVLARVASRSNPHVHLGPVDMTCSFVVVDVRRHDAPIVYCSPTFCRLTGYPENEVLGRNCRFLQAPPGSGEVRRGEPRRFTSQTSVDTMRKALVAGKECQTSIVNFRKDGAAFINLVSIIPIGGGERGEDGEVVYHVGFQVDLTEQPNVIMEKLRNGSYVQPQSQPLTQVDPTTRPSTARQILPPPPPTVTGKSPMALQAPAPIQRKPQMPPLTMSAYLAKVLANPALLRALPITTCTTAPPLLPTSHLSSPPAHLSSSPTTSSSSSQNPATAQTNSPLSLLLLEYSPDPIFVVSLKGAFLYVSPAIQRLLGHRPQDLVGRSIADLAHPEDVVPLERQLKESSSLNPPSNPSTTATNATSTTHEVGVKQERDCDNKDIKDTKEGSHAHARLIDVLFRARTRGGRYVWVEARGRLHVEPGKGRKAIVLSARARGMPCVSWGDILPLPRLPSSSSTRLSSSGDSPRDFWAQLSGLNSSAGTIVSSSPSIRSVLGYTPDEVLARRVPALCVPEDKERVQRAITEIEKGCSGGRRERRKVLFVRMQRGAMGKEAGLGEREREKEVDVVSVRLVFYPTPRDPPELGPSGRPLGIAPPVTLLHVALVPPGFERGSTVECSIDVDHEQHQQHQRQHPPQHQYHEHNTENESGSVAPWHDPSTNIFAELEVSRGSSWQYELQQLRFVNLRLREEVKRLGREVALVEGAGLGLGVGGPSNQMTTDFTGLVEMAEEDDGEVGAFAHQEEFETRRLNPYPLHHAQSICAASGPSATATAMGMEMGMVMPTHYEDESPFAFSVPLPAQQPQLEQIQHHLSEQHHQSSQHPQQQHPQQPLYHHSQQQQQQQHANYTTALDRYAAGADSGAAYGELDMALGMGLGAVDGSLGFGAVGADMGMGMDGDIGGSANVLIEYGVPEVEEQHQVVVEYHQHQQQRPPTSSCRPPTALTFRPPTASMYYSSTSPGSGSGSGSTHGSVYHSSPPSSVYSSSSGAPSHPQSQSPQLYDVQPQLPHQQVQMYTPQLPSQPHHQEQQQPQYALPAPPQPQSQYLPSPLPQQTPQQAMERETERRVRPRMVVHAQRMQMQHGQGGQYPQHPQHRETHHQHQPHPRRVTIHAYDPRSEVWGAMNPGVKRPYQYVGR